MIAFAPGGKKLEDADIARMVASSDPLTLVCGRYEGIDERFLEDYVDEQYCIGDFVLSGGELPALCLIDAVVRRIPGAIKELSTEDESFSTGLLDYPHYTRPKSGAENRCRRCCFRGTTPWWIGGIAIRRSKRLARTALI